MKLIEAAKTLDVKRYVMLSAISADAEHPGEETMDVYIRAKGRADDALRDSGLSYLVVRPGGLTDEQGTGRVEVGESLDGGEIPREDVAAVIAACLRVESPADHSFDVISGPTPIEDAVGYLST